jgi:hypothetical protein
MSRLHVYPIPLILKLVEHPYAIFEVDKSKKMIDFNQVKNKIQSLTDERCGDGKGIVDDPIILSVYSNSCPDLTLIDLPGITRIAVGGQDQDIEKITKGKFSEPYRNFRGQPTKEILTLDMICQ